MRTSAVATLARLLACWLPALALLAVPGCATAPSKPPVTVAQIVQMSKAGVPPDEIIRTINDAGTVYRLSGSQLANLKSQGVPDEVLDYMLNTYVDYERRQATLYWDPFWPGPYWGPYWGPYPYWYWGPGYYMPYWRPRPLPPPAPKPADSSK